MSNRIAAEKEEVARANQSLVALQAQRKVLERLATRIEAANAQMEDIGSIVQKTSDSKDQAQDRKHKIALVVQDTKNEAVARERLDRDIDASQKKLFELKQQYEIKRQQVEQTLEELRRSKRKRQMIATKHAAQALQNESQCEELERKVGSAVGLRRRPDPYSTSSRAALCCSLWFGIAFNRSRNRKKSTSGSCGLSQKNSATSISPSEPTTTGFGSICANSC